MLRKYSKLLSTFFFAIDGLLIISSFVISHILIPGLGWQERYSWLLGLYILLWPLIAAKYSFYSSKRTISLPSEIIDLIKIAITDTVLTVVTTVLLGFHKIEPTLILLFSFGNVLGLFSLRLLVRSVLRFIRRRGYNYRNILIIGTNERSREIARKTTSTPEYGLHILGFIDTKKRREQLHSFEGYRIIECIKNLKEILTKYVVDEVYVTLPIKSFYTEIEEIVRLCEERGVAVKVSPSLFQLRVANNTLTLLDDIPLINIASDSTEIWQLMIKRGIDIGVSFGILILTIPVFIVISILIKLDSRGPVFFRQERVGYNMRKLFIFKFRTMIENAERLKKELQSANEADGPVFKMKNDPRITRIGRFLRKYRLDELPQFINVLKGNMSLVGPRPPLPSEVNKYKWSERRRLSMKPGITCLWQVSGRNDLSFKEWMALDLEYIDNWSLRLDAILFLQTILVVLKGTGI